MEDVGPLVRGGGRGARGRGGFRDGPPDFNGYRNRCVHMTAYLQARVLGHTNIGK